RSVAHPASPPAAPRRRPTRPPRGPDRNQAHASLRPAERARDGLMAVGRTRTEPPRRARARRGDSFMDPIELTRDLVARESPSFAEAPAVDYVAGLLEAAGYRVTRQPVTPGRDNLYAVREPPVVVLSTHLDTVPPSLPLREDDEWLYGRGACDAKGIAAAMIAAAERLATRGERRIGLLFLVGEENGSD